MKLYIRVAKLRKGPNNRLFRMVSSLMKWNFSFNADTISSNTQTMIKYFRMPNAVPSNLFSSPSAMMSMILVSTFPMMNTATTTTMNVTARAM